MTNIGIVGATGLVGREFIKLIGQRGLKFDDLFLFASDGSAGTSIDVPGRGRIRVLKFDQALFGKIDIAFFSAGAEVDRIAVPKAAAMGTVCIDNSSAFRMKSGIPLVVPEINFSSIRKHDKIIANPNCSTIQLVLVLDLLMRIGRIKRIFISTYQAVSGAGREALEQYSSEEKGKTKLTSRSYYGNIIQSIGTIGRNGYCEEEMKIVNETRKILQNASMEISPTVMRVPVLNSHTESVSVEFERKPDFESIKKILRKNKNDVRLCSTSSPYEASGTDYTYVSRLRRDLSSEKIVNMIITADNLRVGAALNGIKIAERMIYEK